jgi:hypothetical protein
LQSMRRVAEKNFTPEQILFELRRERGLHMFEDLKLVSSMEALPQGASILNDSILTSRIYVTKEGRGPIC